VEAVVGAMSDTIHPQVPIHHRQWEDEQVDEGVAP
jgi:hypothetical protein